MSNDQGRALLMSEKDFGAFARGSVPPGTLREKLSAAYFLRENLDMPSALSELRARYLGDWAGPGVHIISLTSRCNSRCSYCAVSSPSGSASGGDMNAATADRTVDFIFGSGTAPLLIEFQGGEPLLGFNVLKRIVRRARARAAKEKRALHFSVVTNLTLMDREKLSFLAEEGVTVCTSLDGPAALHDAQRPLPRGSSHALVEKWLGRIAAARGRSPGFEAPNAICTVTRGSLAAPEAIVDEFVRLGLERAQFGPLDPFGLAAGGGQGYSAAEFRGFYARALDRMLELGARGVKVYEKGARLFVSQLLGGERPRYRNLDLAVRLAYGPDGSVYPSDEARMLAASGDDLFRLGSVFSSDFRSLLALPAARALLLSCFQELTSPACERCALSPYCRVSPAYNYVSQGSFWGDMVSNGRCALYKGVFGIILDRFARPGPRRVLEKWAAYEA
ncbi:MAG: 4Fe-4S cluster-binding domain-containing protein [Elusimicrobiales bacterium]|nr:4Fe-4S cluster-binding domain-containing protein [Elusimicrobiales bacterium]